MEHTPGPWRVNPDFRDGMEQNFHIEAEQGTICFCSGGWPDDAIPEANAQLIAAAPDLLEACETALAKCPFSVGAQKAKRLLEAAMNKAKGDQ